MNIIKIRYAWHNGFGERREVRTFNVAFFALIDIIVWFGFGWFLNVLINY